jgi:hypothetical protein
MDMKQPIEINIEELILHGFPQVDRFKIGEAVRIELARLFTEQGLPAGMSNGINLSMIDGGSFTISKNMNTRAIGNRIAQTVYGGITK